jgi:hypothetical protein
MRRVKLEMEAELFATPSPHAHGLFWRPLALFLTIHATKYLTNLPCLSRCMESFFSLCSAIDDRYTEQIMGSGALWCD